jgi:RNA polymerase sigma factor FliA
MTPETLKARISQAYARQSRAADEERWILDNLSMVKHIARKVATYLAEGPDMEDLVSAGTVGLVRAARAYDSGKNAAFRTYAYIRIRGAIIDELRGKSFLPSAVFQQVRQIRDAYQTLASQTGRIPDDAELAEAAGLSLKELYRTLVNARKQHFLSIHGLSDESPALGSLVPADPSPSPDAQAERKELMGNLARAMQELPVRDSHLVLMF